MKVIITGATGMVGKAVLLEAVKDTKVTAILLLSRRTIGQSYPKVSEVLHQDFTDFSTIASQLKGFDFCCHCMGVSSAGKSEKEFTHYTYTMTKALADALFVYNPNMVFTYVSGQGTDSSEKGRIMWARVKGKTENYLLGKGFKDAYMFRPGIILPEKGIRSSTKLYHWFYVIAKPIFPILEKLKSVTTTTKIGKAMLNIYINPQPNKHLEGEEINTAATLQN
ncbi:NAD-dependent epimerase/dehydratase family protein [Croceivirga sp. JEA036]|uniref:NAD-dependent epimerase/dehydratase family protein n=1 Tax=Croceivirga sp. JEA036 TaxID=2721162 RepID=UPI00143C4EC5|nr:NAD-dependent epimerase/dehydratase family protein [Croceivirga sp. JEA036]NJB35692.1 NAD-dependent epimerase/dehydratase family protein [Croceivirga sp. JEA036]